METFHAEGTPLADYLEGTFEPEPEGIEPSTAAHIENDSHSRNFAPSQTIATRRGKRTSILHPLDTGPGPPTSLGRIHDAWSTAVNSRLGRADNSRFLEHFRYIIVASQLLNEYLDHGTLRSATVSIPSLDGESEQAGLPTLATSLYGAAATALVAFALVYLVHWSRNGKGGFLSKGRLALVLAILTAAALLGYGYVRRQWLKYLRQQAVKAGSNLTMRWQGFETAASSALSLIQEVELVSNGYRLSTPLPPASRVERSGAWRRCGRLRRVLQKSYGSSIPACVDLFNTINDMVDQDDVERYYEVYDINLHDAKDAVRKDASSVPDDDTESLKSLRVSSFRMGLLRRIALCALLSLKADGSKPDFARWSRATEAMDALSTTLDETTINISRVLSDMEHINVPQTPVVKSPNPSIPYGGGREKMRGQVRKISMLSSGIRGLQAKMQILREETNRSIEQSEDLTDLGPHLMAQYDSIGADLKELMQAWEAGKASLVSNITKQERRISLASSGLRSPVSSLGGLTAVDEDGSPAAALRALTGDAKSNRSSMNTTSDSDDQVFEAIAIPRHRSTLTRDERVAKMYEERERQATIRANRDANTSMLKELETVINLRPKKPGPGRITSI
ncbi:hypothetical protein K431DRAFT_28216 [Polychaeton citri CBS 116435]|uniref:Myosin-binding domain-containing protein n=1 Tax=Polychaeton citri CBS 116435 TaxID=1314669 RepID=A0A9P4QEA1_9PEZI|nr:hypothetical protein K431DRAFT_28216 [Polychaeton citri CBS 116435]